MRKAFFVLSVCSAALVFTACQKPDTKEPVNPDAPSITLGIQGNLQVPLEGGLAEIPYEIVNPVDGGKISAVSSEDWAGEFNYDTDGVVAFTVQENEETEARSTIVTLTYTYGGGETVTAQVNVVQDGAVPYDYVYEDLPIFTGTYFSSNGPSGEVNYYTVISDKDLLMGTYLDAGGTYYVLDLYSTTEGEGESLLPPAGTYTLAAYEDCGDMTFSVDYSLGASLDDDGNTIFESVFSAGTVTVSYEGSNMVIVADLVDETGKKHYATYNGSASYFDYNGGNNPGIGGDIDFTAATAVAGYINDREGVMEVNINLTDMEVLPDGTVIPPGTILYLNLFMPLNEEGELMTGSYTAAGDGASGTFFPGEMVDFMGVVYPLGTYVMSVDEAGMSVYGMISDGTVKISGSGGQITLVCDLVTSDGSRVTCDYTGELPVQNIPGPFSTLTGDYTLDLEGCESGEAVYYGDYYETGGGNWYITITPDYTTDYDGFQVDLVAEGMDYEDGIPSGTYTVSPNGYPEPGQYLEGYLTSTSIGGTMFLGGFTADGYVSEFAPATSGDLVITNHGDGTYTFSFEFLDDKGNTWDGEWTGPMELQNRSAAPSAVRRSSLSVEGTAPGFSFSVPAAGKIRL